MKKITAIIVWCILHAIPVVFISLMLTEEAAEREDLINLKLEYSQVLDSIVDHNYKELLNSFEELEKQAEYIRNF